MRNIKKHDAYYGKSDLGDLLDKVLDRVDHDGMPSDYGMPNPDLLDFNSDGQGNHSQPSTMAVASSLKENESLPLTVFYEMCFLSNEKQQKPFNFIMRYSQELQLNKRNDLLDPNPFHIFLSGGAGVGK